MSSDHAHGNHDPPSTGPHLATVSHGGRFWDVYVEFAEHSRHPETWRALLCFSPADRSDGEESVRTAMIIIEDSYEEAMDRARRFEERQLVGLLRSCLPD
jgi:hypothetical protein